MIKASSDQPQAETAELRALIRTLLDESGLIKPSVTISLGIDAPGVIVEGLELQDGGLPTEFRIFKAGENPSTKGTFIFDDEAAASVMSIYAKRKIDLMMDYEHMSLVKPPIIAPASCKRWVPQIRNGELWATECAWTNRAQAMGREGEIRFFSPAFDFDPKTMRVLRIINCALTNNPALDALTPLVAATAAASDGADDDTDDEDDTTEARAMSSKKMKCSTATCSNEMKLKEADADHMEPDGDEAYCAQCRASAVLSGVGQKVIMALGLASDVGEQAALSAVSGLTGLRTELATLTGQASPAAQLGTLTAWKQKAEEADTLRARLAEVETAQLSAELGQVLDAAASGKDPRITPAQRESLKKKALGPDGKPTREGVEFVREFLTAGAAVVSTTQVEQPIAGVALTEDEQRIATILRRPLDQAAADKARAMGARIDGK